MSPGVLSPRPGYDGGKQEVPGSILLSLGCGLGVTEVPPSVCGSVVLPGFPSWASTQWGSGAKSFPKRRALQVWLLPELKPCLNRASPGVESALVLLFFRAAPILLQVPLVPSSPNLRSPSMTTQLASEGQGFRVQPLNGPHFPCDPIYCISLAFWTHLWTCKT